MSLKAVVTGGARGIGLAISERLAKASYEVLVLDIDGSDNTIPCDVGDEKAVAAVAAKNGPVDVLAVSYTHLTLPTTPYV